MPSYCFRFENVICPCIDMSDSKYSITSLKPLHSKIIEDILFTKELLRIILSTEIPVLLGKGKYVVRQIIKTGFAGRKVL